MFLITVRRNVDSRMVVDLPFKDECSLLGESIDIASNRFRFLQRR